MSSSHTILIACVIASILSSTFAVLASNNVLSAFTHENASKKKIVGGHTMGYSAYETTGEILDPTNYDSSKMGDAAVVDPDKYLRSFNYGRASILPYGTVVR